MQSDTLNFFAIYGYQGDVICHSRKKILNLYQRRFKNFVMPGGSVVVADEGNKRVGGPSAPELTQAVEDIKAWFERAPEEWSGTEGAPSADLQRLEKTMETQMPHELELLLNKANGGLWFMEKESFSIDTIRDKLMEYDGDKWWRPSLIPFAGDDSTLLVIDTKGDNGVFEWDLERVSRVRS